jgi:hypothetical protein
VLEEIEMLPSALHRIVNRPEFTGVRVGIGEAAAGAEIDDEFEGFGCGIKLETRVSCFRGSVLSVPIREI